LYRPIKKPDEPFFEGTVVKVLLLSALFLGLLLALARLLGYRRSATGP